MPHWRPPHLPVHFKIKATASGPRPIIDGADTFLGYFLPNFSYWSTPSNIATLQQAMDAGDIETVDTSPIEYEA